MSTSKWHIFPVRKRTPFYVDLYTHGLAYANRDFLDFSTRTKLYHVNGIVIMKEPEFQRERRRVLTRLRRDPRFLLRIMHISYRDYERFYSLWQRIGQLPVAALANKELVVWLKRYVTSINLFWWPGMIPLYVEQDLSEMIEKYVTERFQGVETPKALGTFFMPKKEGVVGEEYHSLLKIAMLPTNKREVALKIHWQQFAWIANQLYTHTFFPFSHYQRRLASLQKKNPQRLLQEYTQRRRAYFRAYNNLINKLKPDARTKAMIETLNEAIFYRSWRGERAYESGFIVAPFIEEIAKRLKVMPQDLLFCTAQEIVHWLTHGDGQWKRVIAARKKGFVYIPTRKGKIITGSVVKMWEREIYETPKVVRELKGVVAFPGVVRGLARIVHGAGNFSKVKRGDIMITVSTTPLYVPVLHKVRAIVTEEGGVLSHASVISREMKIPCVIGISDVTRLLKTGDRVEVDADRGIVRRL